MTGTPHDGEDRLLNHDYDGIQEFDNPMPRWWLWGFYVTIVFAAIYFFDPRHTFEGPGRDAEYAQEMAAFEAAHPKPAGAGDPAVLAAAIADPVRRERGKSVFSQNCAACHRADGGGLIGPNLTDEYWLHGATPPDVYKTIAEGVLAKGMPAWSKMLQPEQLLDVTAYVQQLHESEAVNGKGPEGVEVETESAGSTSS